MKRLVLVLALVACGGDGITGVDISDPKNLVGSYRLAVYNATPNGPNPGGSLDLRADSTFTMAAPDGWGTMTGKWSWTGGNVYLVQQDIYGSIEDGGLAFTVQDRPALYFRKR